MHGKPLSQHKSHIIIESPDDSDEVKDVRAQRDGNNNNWRGVPDSYYGIPQRRYSHDAMDVDHHHGNRMHHASHDRHHTHHSHHISHSTSSYFSTPNSSFFSEHASPRVTSLSVPPSIPQHSGTVVVLDCANIGWAYGIDRFCIRGVQLALQMLSKYMLHVVAFLPASYHRRRPARGDRGNALMETDEWEVLDSLVHQRVVTIVPAGDADDLYILTFARQRSGYVISNDHYTDHLQSLTDAAVKQLTIEWLSRHRCSYAFVGDEFMLNPARYVYIVYHDKYNMMVQ